MLRDIATGYQEGGADYVYALLTGYRTSRRSEPTGASSRRGHGRIEPAARQDADGRMQMHDGMYYNVAFPGHQLAMPPPLSKDNFVEYQRREPARSSRTRSDVAAFLAWAADPILRYAQAARLAGAALSPLTTLLLYLAKKRIWAKVGTEALPRRSESG